MKKILLLTAAIALANQANAELMITGVIDGPLTGGIPKAVELYATENITDLSIYAIGSVTNGNGSLTAEYTLPAVAMASGSYIWITNNAEGFSTYFGFAADYVNGTISGNGDDAYGLLKDGVVHDVYGDINTDGTGTVWDYLDGWAYRNNNTGANGGVFTAANWTFSGANALDGTSTNTTMPVNGVAPEVPADLELGLCDAPATLISSIQGNEATSPLFGNQVIVEAIVYQDLQGDENSFQYSGFFVQEEDADSDSDATTSEGLFVYDYKSDVSVGDKVRLVGTIDEYRGITQLKSIIDYAVCSTGNRLPSTAVLTLPVSSLDEIEQLEGMNVTLAGTQVVSDFYGTGYGFINYGQFVVSSELHYQPTAITEPSVESYNDAVDYFRRDSILIDDGVAASNPDLIPFPTAAGFSNENYFRVGYQISNISGAVHGYDSGSTKLPYSIIPTVTPTFDAAGNDRTLEPYIDNSANLVIASMNVLNLFNGVVVDGVTVFPTQEEEDNDTYGDYRGANSAADYEIQLGKIVSALKAMDADIIGLMEIENDGFDETSAIQSLTDALNAEVAADKQYKFVNPGSAIGSDAIAVGLLYRASTLRLAKDAVILDSSNSPLDENGEPLFLDTKNRPSLIQSFILTENFSPFTVSINHLKSKGSNCNALDDPDLGDGAGNCNLTRTRAVQGLVEFMATNPTGIRTNNIIFMGDMNSYAKEQPIAAFEDARYVNLKDTDASTEETPFSYSYSGFLGSLDYIIASKKMTKSLLSIDAWHINSVESDVFDYDTDLDKYESNDTYASVDPYYSSDHDPIVASFELKGGALGLAAPFLLLLLIGRRKSSEI